MKDITVRNSVNYRNNNLSVNWLGIILSNYIHNFLSGCRGAWLISVALEATVRWFESNHPDHFYRGVVQPV